MSRDDRKSLWGQDHSASSLMTLGGPGGRVLIGCERLGEGEWKGAAKMEERIDSSTRLEQPRPPTVTCTWGLEARWLPEIDTARVAVWLWPGTCKSGPHLTCTPPLLGSFLHSSMDMGKVGGRRGKVFQPGTPKRGEAGRHTPAQRCRVVNTKS